ncbi:MAG: hypothetical protein CSB06_03250 [Bacteroidia bacterium]|nr:MAG: hypothetical protein CSB06_03250 [Bacteroidia bacterium]
MDVFKNYNRSHLSEQQVSEIKDALSHLENLLSDTILNLSIDERRKYGSVNEQNKLLINKVHDFYVDQPSLRSPDVDWDEFLRDFNSRRMLEGLINRMENITNGLTNAKILHDHDNYQAALDDYAYTNYKVNTSAAGFEIKQTELKQFFSRTRNKEDKKMENKDKKENTSKTEK